MKTTRQEKKIEAVGRLRMLGILPEVIDLFMETDAVMGTENMDGLFCELSDELQYLVKGFEEKHNRLVYFTHFCDTEFAGCFPCFM